MNYRDNIQSFIFEQADIRGEIVHLDESYLTIVNQHSYPPFIKKLLGEALAAVALLSVIIKFEGRMTLQFQGKDELKLFIAQCNNNLELRGLVDWRGNSEPAKLGCLFDAGTLAIMMNPNKKSGKSYQSIVSWHGESLANSLENYFHLSEQIPTRFWLEANETRAAGLLLQVLPQQFSESSKWDELTAITDKIPTRTILASENQELLTNLYPEENIRLFSPRPVTFRCTCSLKSSENAILLLGRQEAEAELKDKQKIVVICEFCNQEFTFDRATVDKIFSHDSQSPPTQLH